MYEKVVKEHVQVILDVSAIISNNNSTPYPIIDLQSIWTQTNQIRKIVRNNSYETVF